MNPRESLGYAVQVLCSLLCLMLAGLALGTVYGIEASTWIWGWPVLMLGAAWLGFIGGAKVVEFVDHICTE